MAKLKTPMAHSVSMLFVTLILLSCSSTRSTPLSHDKALLIIGSSGGVTGMIREYALLDNGDLFVSKGLKGDWKFLRELKRPVVNDLFEEAETIALMSYRFSHPGNMTYYIIYRDGKRKNEVKWGETGVEVNPEVKQFYDKLVKMF